MNGRLPDARRCLLRLAILPLAFGVGCGKNEPAAQNEPEKTESVTSNATDAPDTTAAKDDTTSKSAPKTESASARLAEAKRQLEADDLAAAGATLDSARPLVAPDSPDATTLAELEAQLASRAQASGGKRRTEALASAEKLLSAGDLTASAQALETVLALGPDREQLAAANTMKKEIERRRRLRRELKTSIQSLAGDQREQVRAAQSRLAQEPEDALPLLLESLASDEPKQVVGSLEMLRRLRSPERALPAMVGVIANSSVAACRQAAVEELARTNEAGAGKPLLDLALATEDAPRRVAALAALARVPDPPADTMPKLAPILAQDGEELAPALEACVQAAIVHRQFDFAARRGIDPLAVPEGSVAWNDLRARLLKLAAPATETTPEGKSPELVALAAQRLALAGRLLAPVKLEGIKLHTASAEEATSPAAALLDEKWNTVDLATMWRHPLGKRSAIVLDLGRLRTVSHVKIWNYNESGAGHRGWKDVEIFVSDDPSALVPAAVGIVAPAPGQADVPDFGTMIPVPLIRGRYVKLQAKNVWREDNWMGLSEVEVHGL